MNDRNEIAAKQISPKQGDSMLSSVGYETDGPDLIQMVTDVVKLLHLETYGLQGHHDPQFELCLASSSEESYEENLNKTVERRYHAIVRPPSRPEASNQSSDLRDLEASWMARLGRGRNAQGDSVNFLSQPKQLRACSFFLRGHCKKENCEFAHDIRKVPCKFWLAQECHKGSTCPFRHDYPQLL